MSENKLLSQKKDEKEKRATEKHSNSQNNKSTNPIDSRTLSYNGYLFGNVLNAVNMSLEYSKGLKELTPSKIEEAKRFNRAFFNGKYPLYLCNYFSVSSLDTTEAVKKVYAYQKSKASNPKNIDGKLGKNTIDRLRSEGVYPGGAYFDMKDAEGKQKKLAGGNTGEDKQVNNSATTGYAPGYENGGYYGNIPDKYQYDYGRDGGYYGNIPDYVEPNYAAQIDISHAGDPFEFAMDNPDYTKNALIGFGASTTQSAYTTLTMGLDNGLFGGMLKPLTPLLNEVNFIDIMRDENNTGFENYSYDSGIDGEKYGEYLTAIVTAGATLRQIGIKGLKNVLKGFADALVNGFKSFKSVNTSSELSKVVKSGSDVTDDVIRSAMEGAELQTQQGKISKPMIQDYVDKYLNGEIPPPIKVHKNIIVEGNHRYVAGKIVGIEPPVRPSPGGRVEEVVSWDDLIIETIDWRKKCQ